MSSVKTFVLVMLLLSILVVGVSWFGLQLTAADAMSVIETVRSQRSAVATSAPDANDLTQARLAPVQHTVADPVAQDPVRAVSQNSSYYIAVSYVQTATAALGDQPITRTIVTAVLGNKSPQTMTVAQNALRLITRDGRQFNANPPDDQSRPALIGTPIGADSTLYGFVTFDGVADLTGARLTWCVSGAQPCQEQIQAELP